MNQELSKIANSLDFVKVIVVTDSKAVIAPKSLQMGRGYRPDPAAVGLCASAVSAIVAPWVIVEVTDAFVVLSLRERTRLEKMQFWR